MRFVPRATFLAMLKCMSSVRIAPVNAADMVDVIDANLGELSTFHDAYGFYVHGVSIDAAVLPVGWKDRAIAVRNDNTRNTTGWCVEAHDLAVSKLVAFRDKDRAFVRVLLVESLIEPETLRLRISQLPKPHRRVTPQLLDTIKGWVDGVLKDIGALGE